MITIGKTTVSPGFDSGTFLGKFSTNNEYLSDYWFCSNHPIWNIISVKLALIIEEEVKKNIKPEMNKESYKEIFGNCTKQEKVE